MKYLILVFRRWALDPDHWGLLYHLAAIIIPWVSFLISLFTLWFPIHEWDNSNDTYLMGLVKRIKLHLISNILWSSISTWWGFKYTLPIATVGFPGNSAIICLPRQEMQVWSLSQEDPPEKKMSTHSYILTWKTSWTEELGELQSMESQKSQTRLSDQTTTATAVLITFVLRFNGVSLLYIFTNSTIMNHRNEIHNRT